MVLLSISVSAICGDFRCDPEEGKRFCKTDCLLAGDYCCSDMWCQECSSMICKRSTCKPYGIVDQVKVDDVACFPDGSITLDAMFEKSPGREIYTSTDIKVEFKAASQFAALSPLSGSWFDNRGEVTIIKKHGWHTFASSPGKIKNPGTYIVRVKYRIGKHNQFGIDTEFSCLDIEPEKLAPEEETAEEEIAEVEEEVVKVEEEVEELKGEMEELKKDVDIIKSQVEEEEESLEEVEEQIIEAEEESSINEDYLITAIVGLFLIIFYLIYKPRPKQKRKK